MSAQVSFNPFVITVASGMFNTRSTGLRQGTAYPDPATRYALRQGVLDSTETIPMWGGVGIYENVPGVSGGPAVALGVTVGRATALTGSKALAGFSVFDQDYSMITTPQSPVPQAGSGNTVMSYALGSRARIAVAADPALASLVGGAIGAQVSWDFVNQLLVPYVASAGTVNATGSSYVSGTGVVTIKATGALTGFDVGDAVVIAGLTGSGADLAAANGTYTIASKPAADTITYVIATGLTIATITGGSITPGSGAASALPVKVLNVQTTNCMVVVRDAVTGFLTYNYDGCAAVIQI